MFESWHPYPLVRILLPFVLGILVGDALQWSCPGIVLLSVLLSLSVWSVWSFTPTGTRWFGLCWLIWIALAGTSYPAFRQPDLDPNHWTRNYHIQEGTSTEFSGEVESVTHKGKWKRVLIDVTHVSLKGQQQNATGKLLVYVPAVEEEPVFEGKMITFQGNPIPVPPSSDPYGFDWRRYLFVRGVSYQVFLKEVPVIQDSRSVWRSTMAKARLQVQGSLDQLIAEPQARQLLSAIMLGARDEMGVEVSQAYQASGAVHILAVSGLHVGLVAGMALFLVSFLWPSRRHSWIVVLPVILLVWAYVFLTGAADSALRAGVLFSFLLLGRAMKRYGEGLNLLAGAVLLLLLLDPFMIFHVGFQLSVLAVAGILVLQPLIFQSWLPPGRVSRFFWNLTAVTLAAQAATLVVSLYYFHQLPVYFMLSGLFVVPLSGMLLGSGWIVVLLQLIAGQWALWFGWIPEILARLMNALVFGIASLPGSISSGWSPAVWWTILVPVILATGLYAIRYRGKGVLIGALALSLGLVLDVGNLLYKRTISDWGVIRRQGKGIELMVRHQGSCLLMDLSGEQSGVELVQLPGYGTTWLAPAYLDLDFGFVSKRGKVLTTCSDTLSWGSLALAPAHIAIGKPDPAMRQPFPESLILPFGIRFRDRLEWEELPVSHRVDLRDHGYWTQSIEDCSDQIRLGSL